MSVLVCISRPMGGRRLRGGGDGRIVFAVTSLNSLYYVSATREFTEVSTVDGWGGDANFRILSLRNGDKARPCEFYDEKEKENRPALG